MMKKAPKAKSLRKYKAEPAKAPAPKSGWQPIETAPKGKQVLVNTASGPLAATYENGNWWAIVKDDPTVIAPTHWQPLSKPPKVAS